MCVCGDVMKATCDPVRPTVWDAEAERYAPLPHPQIDAICHGKPGAIGTSIHITRASPESGMTRDRFWNDAMAKLEGQPDLSFPEWQARVGDIIAQYNRLPATPKPSMPILIQHTGDERICLTCRGFGEVQDRYTQCVVDCWACGSRGTLP